MGGFVPADALDCAEGEADVEDAEVDPDDDDDPLDDDEDEDVDDAPVFLDLLDVLFVSFEVDFDADVVAEDALVLPFSLLSVSSLSSLSPSLSSSDDVEDPSLVAPPPPVGAELEEVAVLELAPVLLEPDEEDDVPPLDDVLFDEEVAAEPDVEPVADVPSLPLVLLVPSPSPLLVLLLLLPSPEVDEDASDDEDDEGGFSTGGSAKTTERRCS